MNDIRSGKSSIEDKLIDAVALCYLATERSIGVSLYDVQLEAALAMREGAITEVKTGEGKTLVATMPAYLNALTGKGVHIVTVNDYLAVRDAGEMGRIRISRAAHRCYN